MSLTGIISSERSIHETSVGRVLRTGFARAIELAQVPVRYYRGRSQLRALAAMSDHELRDVGLTRGDLASVTALPAGVDPTSALASIVNERRRWQRGR